MRPERLAVFGIPILLALMLGWQVVSGRIYLYIHDRSVWLIVLSVPLLLALGLVTFRRRGRAVAARSWGLVALPLLLAVLLPARPLGSAALEAQAASGTSLALADVSGPHSFQPVDRVWDLKQLGLLEARQPDLSELDGQRADLIGFVHRVDSLSSDEFLVGRFVVRCCTADAVAISFPVRYDNAADLTRDTWVDVQGTIMAVDASAGTRRVLVADSVRAIPEPSRPYLQLP
jgi:putative membrane protein